MEQAGATVAAALAVLNRALHAHRIAAADPYAGEVALRHALVTRVGYGTGEQVADGGWTAARELPPERARIARESALRPQERFAALLSGRDAALACELLALRARLDLEHAPRPRGRAATRGRAGRGAGGAGELARARRDGGAAGGAALAGRRRRAPRPRPRARARSTRRDARWWSGALGRLEAALRARTAGARSDARSRGASRPGVTSTAALREGPECAAASRGPASTCHGAPIDARARRRVATTLGMHRDGQRRTPARTGCARRWASSRRQRRSPAARGLDVTRRAPPPALRTLPQCRR